MQECTGTVLNECFRMNRNFVWCQDEEKENETAFCLRGWWLKIIFWVTGAFWHRSCGTIDWWGVLIPSRGNCRLFSSNFRGGNYFWNHWDISVERKYHMWWENCLDAVRWGLGIKFRNASRPLPRMHRELYRENTARGNVPRRDEVVMVPWKKKKSRAAVDGYVNFLFWNS